jgi:uncharacterized protein (DUF2345 family)
MTEKIVIRAKKNVNLTEAEGSQIRDELIKAYHVAHTEIEERWGVSIVLETI